MPEPHPVVQALAARRREIGMSQWRLAELTGTRQSAISEIETGETSNPNLGTLLRMAGALGCDLAMELRLRAEVPGRG